MKNLIAFTVLFLFFNTINAQSGYYIKFEGIIGESMEKDHEGWSDLLSVSQTIQKLTGEIKETNRIVCEKELDKSSPKLQEAANNSYVIPKVEIHFTTSISGAKQAYFIYELKNVRILGYNLKGAGSGNVPSEEIVVSFEEIKVIYKEFYGSGKVKGTVEYSGKI